MLDASFSKIVGVEVLVMVDDYSGFTRLLAEHGFSALVSVSYEDGREFRVLLDAGSSGRVLLKNASSLGVDLGSVDAIVLSHRHYDHSGGLAALARTAEGKPVIAHPDALKPCYSRSRGFTRFNVGLPPAVRDSLRRFELVLAKEPLELAPGVWFMGEIDRHYDNSYAVEDFKTIIDGTLVDELLLDDTAVAVVVGERAVVVAGCSHSGVANIARQARKLTGAREVVMMGGFHLAAADAKAVARVVEDLANEGVVGVHAGHCTGLKGEAKLLERFDRRMSKMHSGYRVRL